MTTRIILLEGIDGCGKSTVASIIRRMAREEGLSTISARDPGCTPFGEAIRGIVADADIQIDPFAQCLAFMAARAQLTAWLDDMIKRVDLIVLDRYWHSTIAYQCFGGGIDTSLVQEVVNHTNSVYPNAKIPIKLAFCLDVDVEVAHERRMADRERAGERFKAADMEFKRRVAAGYKYLMESQLTRIEVGDSTAEEIATIIFQRWKDQQ